ncbi:MAG: hypothetical protein IKT67_01045 [Lachnospiraceae bacterium]|nr:hypothetical protein [Lachnospiraceae bacterium]
MRKGLFAALTILCLAAFAGCSKDKPGEPEATKGVASETTFVSEDYIPGSEALRKTDKGIYYYNKKLNAFRYIDFGTGNEMYLCNKPECRHDGNTFCVATNQNYTIDRFCIYNGKIIATGVEETDTEYLYKVFTIALDGSEMNEIATYHTAVKNGSAGGVSERNGVLYVHRNKVLLRLAIPGQEGLEDSAQYGTAILDLNTKEITWLDEEPVSKDNVSVTDIFPQGDYFYYCQKEGKKTVLHRYRITDGIHETFKLLTGFKGIYTVLGENIFYSKGNGDVLCVHHINTGENEEKPLSRTHIKYAWDGTGEEEEWKYRITDLLTDGTYLYIPEPTSSFVSNEPDAGGVAEWTEACLNIFDGNGTVVNSHDLVEELQCEANGEAVYGETEDLYFTGEEVYCRMRSENEANYDKNYIFKCKRSDLLEGNPKFEYVVETESGVWY